MRYELYATQDILMQHGIFYDIVDTKYNRISNVRNRSLSSLLEDFNKSASVFSVYSNFWYKMEQPFKEWEERDTAIEYKLILKTDNFKNIKKEYPELFI